MDEKWQGLASNNPRDLPISRGQNSGRTSSRLGRSLSLVKGQSPDRRRGKLSVAEKKYKRFISSPGLAKEEEVGVELRDVTARFQSPIRQDPTAGSPSLPSSPNYTCPYIYVSGS